MKIIDKEYPAQTFESKDFRGLLTREKRELPLTWKEHWQIIKNYLDKKES